MLGEGNSENLMEKALFTFERIGQRRKAYEEVADQILAGIRKGQLKLGDKLPSERDLTDQFGVSRVVVREAIRTLEMAGFVSVRKGPKGGVFVAQEYDRPILDSIGNMLASGEVGLRDLFVVRKVVESYAITHLAECGTENDFKQLEALIREAEADKSIGLNIRPFNIRFHRQVVRLCGNSLLVVIGETALTLLSDWLAGAASAELSDFHLDCHRRLLKALRDKTPDVAKELLTRDIDSLLGILEKVELAREV